MKPGGKKPSVSWKLWDATDQLLQIVGALRPTGRFAACLHGRQQERDQDADDGDHHQEFDQREAARRGGD